MHHLLLYFIEYVCKLLKQTKYANVIKSCLVLISGIGPIDRACKHSDQVIRSSYPIKIKTQQ